MEKNRSLNPIVLWMIPLVLLMPSCREVDPEISHEVSLNAFEQYVVRTDTNFKFRLITSIAKEDYDVYVIRMISQKWLTTSEVKDPVWWHWLTIVVPKVVKSNTGLLWIGSGNRQTAQPSEASPLEVEIAVQTQTVTARLHNVPNQPVHFLQDTFGPRIEDELIAYGWRKYLEGGAKDVDARWLARLPMTKAAVKAMDVVSEFCHSELDLEVVNFTVSGASKRGWTTWTTAVADDRVVAIVPVVIDLLNIVPSFQHHWQAYGFWAPAVGNYEAEGIMEWQSSPEYANLMTLVEPYSYRRRLTVPKLLINATGDQFFLPDSWQFYWSELSGEKYLRYVANADHSLSGSDAMQSLIAFHDAIVSQETRPNFNWNTESDTIYLTTDQEHQPDSIFLWQAHNRQARDFRLETIGNDWEKQSIEVDQSGVYIITIPNPASGWSAFFAELLYFREDHAPFKFSTGVVVIPDVFPHPPYHPKR